jgi:hypothetical protein
MSMANDHMQGRAGDRMSPFIPVLILTLSYAGWAGFQMAQLMQERDNLASLRVSQDKQVEDSKKLRESLDKLAKATLALSNQGNANARLIVDELRRRGVTINPDATPPTPPPGETKK